MIYFIQDTVTQAIKIGYSKDPLKRQTGLQTATANRLVLLGTLYGGLEHESAFHDRFAEQRLQGEWFSGAILPDVLEIIKAASSCPQEPKISVIVSGDSSSYFVFSSDRQQMVNRNGLEALVFRTLSELHNTTPIAWIITGGERLLEHFAWAWAKQNRVEVYRYMPNWKKHGRFAGFKIGPRLLRSMFDPKVLLVFVSGKESRSTTNLIRRAQESGIPVLRNALE